MAKKKTSGTKAEKKAASTKPAKKAVKASGKKAMESRKRNLLIIGAILIMVIISIALAYSMQKQPAETGSIPSTAVESGALGDAAAVGASWPVDSEVKKIVLETDQGRVVMEVYPELMPITVENFVKLVDSKFYDGLTFHRVEDWVIQGGDPQGNGTGGPGWTIQLETNPQLKNVRGAVAMARSQDPNSAGSQFYILKQDASGLDGQYAVFGRVVEGMEVVDCIKPGDRMKTVTAVN